MCPSDTVSRSDWNVRLTSEAMMIAAERLVGYHGERVMWWSRELENAEANIRETGVEIRRHQQTGGDRFEATVDPGLARRLHECEQKLAQHRRQVDEYRQWVAFFVEATGRSWEVSHADFAYFDVGQIRPTLSAEEAS